MYEIADENVKTLTMDHHGLVASVCRDLKLAERIDERLGKVDKRRIVSTGQAVVAMILNGLGFTNRRLYLTAQFFENKPVDVLIGTGIKAKDLTDYTLGHALDEISDYDSSKLFGEVSFDIALDEDMLSTVNHLDSTSFYVEGEYNKSTESDEVIHITHGYSKDHRPDLKQIMLSLVVNGPSSIPLWMEPHDGNSSDKKSFHETIKRVNDFKSQLKIEKDFRWIADSALYTKDKLLKTNNYRWITRVPEIITEAKNLLSKSDEEFSWEVHEKGYKTASVSSDYGQIQQRWIVVSSEQAYVREKKTLDKKLDQQSEELTKMLWHLGNQAFSCEKDALDAANKAIKKYKFFDVKFEVNSIKKYAGRGRPQLGEEKKVITYKVSGVHKRNELAIEEKLNSKGRFILSTNDLDTKNYSDKKILSDYKQQQNVERGFRFLKDPWFMIDSIFLKKAKRIEGLMMVMTLCLLVYNIAQYKIRKKLVEEEETLPNQLGKEIQNPTTRWIFQLMEGINIVQFFKSKSAEISKEIITNLSILRKKIVRLFGETALKIYGLIQKNEPEILEM